MMNKEKKKPNIVLFTIFMTVIFLVLTEFVIYGALGSFITSNIMYENKGSLVISEAVLAILILIVMLIFKNGYVFTQKKDKVHKGLFYGLYYIIGSLLFILFFGIAGGALKNISGVINLLIGCFFLGMAEEFLCRGWLLNEFLERYGDTKKGIWYSIIVSGVIFGLIHLGNIATGQPVFTTIQQALFAAAAGIMYGLIYYKTKNIWSVIILHGLWDFALFLSQIKLVTQNQSTLINPSLINIAIALLICGIELLNIIPYVKDINAKPKKKTVILLAICTIIGYIMLTLINGLIMIDYKNVQTYKYDSINIENYATTTDNYASYYINYTNNPKAFVDKELYSFELSKNSKNNLVLTNKTTNYSIEIECEELFDYIIMEEENYYVLAYLDYTDSANYYLNYIYIQKQNLSNTNEYLDSIKNNIKKYLVSGDRYSKLVVINDQEKNASYVAVYTVDYGYYLLIGEDKVAILNRDK